MLTTNGLKFKSGEDVALNPQSYKYLDSIFELLNKYPYYNLVVDVYFDSGKTDTSYNDFISQCRANEIRAYLLSKGIKNDRLILQAKGNNNKIDEGVGLKSQRKNTRTIFSLTINK